MLQILIRSVGKPLRSNPRKFLKNKELKINTPLLTPVTHSYIEFKHYTGNEIIYTLKNYKKLRPGEISSALLELGLRKGLPSDFDWNKHPCIQELKTHLIEYIPRYTCRVLTSLAHGLNRLKITDQVLWEKLAHHILRTITSIEPVGLSNCFPAFAHKNLPDFYSNMLSILPVYMSLLDTKDFMNIIQGLHTEGLDSDLYTSEFYPFITKRVSEFSISQLNKLQEILKTRQDFTEDLAKTIKASIDEKLNTRKTISFGGTDNKRPQYRQLTNNKH